MLRMHGYQIFLPLMISILSISIVLSQDGSRALSVADIEDLLTAGVTSKRLVTLIEERGVRFQVTDDIRRRLKQGGADQQIIQAVERAGLEFIKTQAPKAELRVLIEGLRAGTIQRQGKDNAEMVYIPAGTFTMGGNRRRDEMPPHNVRLEGYWIDRTPVTNSQFSQLFRTGYRVRGGWQKPSTSGKERHPAAHVTWHDASSYCQWAGKRLPTEAEWEYAARGSDGREYPWGNKWEAGRSYHGPTAWTLTTPVGRYPSGASPFGVLDMAGNGVEWVNSRHLPYPYVSTDGREDLTAPGPRVVRKSSGTASPGEMDRSAGRIGREPTTSGIGYVFRCAEEP